MLDPVLLLVGCLLAVGAWALPKPAPPRRTGPDLERMFPSNQLSRLGTALITPVEPRLDRKFVDEARQDRASLVRFTSYEHAVRSHREWIYYVMKRDEEFLTCMTMPYDLSTFFFAAEVCQKRGGHKYGIYFPRLEDFYPNRKELPRFSKAKMRARARQKPNNAFQHTPSVPLPALRLFPPPPLHALSRMISTVAATARSVERAVETAHWAKWEAEPKALLLEGHYY
ncbi:MAG: hypothetical protein M1826_004047 [Phylliscum demangeonii]|nr:MAG: hypothetical protein M1826_004047 [Phylliscum demangeonii]